MRAHSSTLHATQMRLAGRDGGPRVPRGSAAQRAAESKGRTAATRLRLVGRDDGHRGLGAQLGVAVPQLAVHLGSVGAEGGAERGAASKKQRRFGRRRQVQSAGDAGRRSSGPPVSPACLPASLQHPASTGRLPGSTSAPLAAHLQHHLRLLLVHQRGAALRHRLLRTRVRGRAAAGIVHGWGWAAARSGGREPVGPGCKRRVASRPPAALGCPTASPAGQPAPSQAQPINQKRPADATEAAAPVTQAGAPCP